MIAKEIQKMQEEWLLLQPLAADCAKRLKEKFRLEFNYNSNHLEGNTLTYGETKLFILFDETKGKHEFREYAEMKAHDVALVMIEYEAADKERPLTEAFIRRLNETILVSPFWKEAETADGQSTRKLITIGEYKKLRTMCVWQMAKYLSTPHPKKPPFSASLKLVLSPYFLNLKAQVTDRVICFI